MFSINGLNMKKLTGVLLSLMVASSAMAEAPILMVGASYGSAVTPFNDALQAPQGGTSVSSGSYLSLGNALIRNKSLSGHVINEAQAGATTFDRLFCRAECVEGVVWHGNETQFTKALARVAFADPVTGETRYNADYLVVVTGNDCLHSGAMGIPHSETSPCTLDQVHEHVDRLISLGQMALDKGITPIFLDLPAYNDLDLPHFGSVFGLQWVIDEPTYNAMISVSYDRINAELPDAVQLKVWKKFNVLADGIHPDDKSTKRAAKRIARYIRSHRQGE
ncbi:MAG: hypothetical protein ACI8WB_000514 [Phenylobacterium sp.]|jgi:hypothetical protein